ncbi:MAG: MBL fold metallo-hydrolase [Candidatus Lambdaproteobacteria bacterium]|nr:MBL fold metallo-hydrolase [Candidatus Lambdaproteobacteria bacterium]
MLKPVERMTVQILVDNVTDSLSTNPEHIDSELRCLMERGLRVWSGESICCAHHGLSLVLTAESAGARHTMLFDAGPEAYAVQRNGDRLGIDFAAIDAMMLSHGHWDHAGGMLEAARAIRRARPQGDLPCYLHPGMFRQRGRQLPNGQVSPMADVPRPEDYGREGAQPVVVDAACTALDDRFFVSGEIPRVTSYEKGMLGQVARAVESDPWTPDPLIMDERFLAAHVQDKGLVVFTACSHAGLINVLTEARRQLPGIPLHAVVGGFHLAGEHPEKIIPETVRDLAGFGARWIVPSHCTGWRAVTALVNAFGEDHVVPGAVGKRIRF